MIIKIKNPMKFPTVQRVDKTIGILFFGKIL